MAEKIYFKAFSFKEKVFNDGGSVLNVSFHIDKAIAELEGLRQYANDKGYVNANISKRSQPTEYGQTHYMTLATEYKPSATSNSYSTNVKSATIIPQPQSNPRTLIDDLADNSEDLPF